MAHRHPHLMITRHDLERAEAYARHHATRRDPDLGRGHHWKGEAVQSLEVLTAAFASGVVKGKYGPVSLGPVPADLLAFALLKGAAMYFSGHGWSWHASNLADGVGAGFAHTLGAGVGVSMGLSTGKTPFKASGRLSGGNGAPLTEAELAAMARAVR